MKLDMQRLQSITGNWVAAIGFLISVRLFEKPLKEP
jgi:hypothetical protein